MSNNKRVLLNVDDTEDTSDKAVKFHFPLLNCSCWVSRKYFEALPKAIIVPNWYFEKYIKPAKH